MEQIETISVDLTWSLWTASEGHFREQAGDEAVDRMRAAFDGTQGPVLIVTVPRKEIRFGHVLIGKGCATVHFFADYDEGEEPPEYHERSEIATTDWTAMLEAVNEVEDRVIEWERVQAL